MNESVFDYFTLVKVAAIQLTATADIDANLALARRLIRRAAKCADLVVLPEDFAFNGPMQEKREIAENIKMGGGPILKMLKEESQKNCVTIIAGGVPTRAEKKGKKILNTSVVFDSTGSILQTYSKIHLFDAVVGEKVYRESAFVERGTSPALFIFQNRKVAISICYDLRFPELYREYSRVGAQVIVVTAAFTKKTGQAHWETLLRARAIENQCFVIAAGQWGIHGNGLETFGHSMVVDPWGEIVQQKKQGVGVIFAELDFGILKDVRTRLPCLNHRVL